MSSALSRARRGLAITVADLGNAPFNVLVNGLGASPVVPRILRSLLYRLAGIDIAVNALVQDRVSVRSSKLSIGEGTTINRLCVIENVEQVTIGRYCGIGIGVQIITTSHDSSDPRARAGKGVVAPVTIGEGVWIGSGAVILAGVTVGDGCVIGAGAIVNKDCQEHQFYAGIPARRMKALTT